MIGINMDIVDINKGVNKRIVNINIDINTYEVSYLSYSLW